MVVPSTTMTVEELNYAPTPAGLVHPRPGGVSAAGAVVAPAETQAGCGVRSTDHSAASAASRRVTVITPLLPAIFTWPKNCKPAAGDRFSWSGSGAFTYLT